MAVLAGGAAAQEPRIVPNVGAYGAAAPVDDEALAIFKQATAGLEEGFAPLTVARQVVAGMNYRFICESKSDRQDAPARRVRIVVYKPLRGAPRVTKIEPLP